MDKKRFFRVLVCFVLICSLIINNSPIKAKAIAIEAVAVTGIGIAAMAILMAAGVVFTPPPGVDNNSLINGLGHSLEDSLNGWANTEEKQSEVAAWVEGCTSSFFGGPDAPEDPNFHKNQVRLARGILAGIVAWVGSIILDKERVEVESEGEAAPEGYMYYNGELLPDISTVWTDVATYPEAAIWHSTSYLLLLSRDISSRSTNSSELYFSGPYLVYSFNPSFNTSWVPFSSGTSSNDYSTPYTGIWSNVDIPRSPSASTNWVDASIPTSSLIETSIVSPSTYVGDIPQQVQDGTMDEETLASSLPVTIDLSSIISSDDTAADDLVDTASKLSDGTISYNEYITNITVKDDSPSDTDTDIDNDSDTETDISDYGLDLTDFFPFCIPFDIYEFLSILAADPVAPVFKWEISVPQLGQTFDVELDLSTWDSVAALFRKLELLGFILGLAYVTREKYLRG